MFCFSNLMKRNISVVYNAIICFTNIYEFSASQDLLSIMRNNIYFKRI